MGAATTFFSTTSGSTTAGASFSAWLQELASPYLSWVDNQWLTLMSKTTLSDALVFTIGTYVIHEVMSAIFATFYCLAHYRGWFKEYRIQTQAPFDIKLFKVALREFLKRTFITDFPAMWLMYYGFHHFGTRVREPLPPASTILWHWTLSWLWTETTFYWSHRMFHHKLLYKHIHKQHHEFKTSVALNTEYAHPIEHIIGNVLTTFGGPLLLGSHVLVWWAYLLFRLWETFDAHSGYTIPVLSPFSSIPWWTGSRMHDFHHSHNVGAYGTMTCFWDWICGTDKAYREYYARKKEQKASSNGNGNGAAGAAKKQK